MPFDLTSSIAISALSNRADLPKMASFSSSFGTYEFAMPWVDSSRKYIQAMKLPTKFPSYAELSGSMSGLLLWATAVLHPMYIRLMTHISDRISTEDLRLLYSFIFETSFLPYASYTLMCASVLCIFFVLRNVSIPYPDIIEEIEVDVKRIQDIDAYEFPVPTVVVRSKSCLLTTRVDRSVRDDLKNFITVKAREFCSPGMQRKDSVSTRNSSVSGYSPASHGTDYYMESEEHSLVSDDGDSEVSRSDHRLYDHTEDSLIRESAANPSLLIGWQINAKGRGVGLILDMKKSLGRATKFIVQFENGKIKLLSLKRSDKKGSIPFSLIMKVSN